MINKNKKNIGKKKTIRDESGNIITDIDLIRRESYTPGILYIIMTQAPISSALLIIRLIRI